MSDQCARVRITETGGFAGNVPRPPRVDLTRGSLDEAQSQSMDEACRQLLALAGADRAAAPASSTHRGADLPGFRVEIEVENGETRTFEIPYSGRQGSADIDAVIRRLENLSPSAQ